jgi:hypothetical protein
MSGLSDLKRSMRRFRDLKPTRPERRLAPRLAACYQHGTGFTPNGASTFIPADIKDISSTGIFLRTQQQLPMGEEVTINLWEADDFESISELQISLPARVTRHAEGGIGLSFVLPPGLNQGLWDLLLRNIVILSNHRHAAELFRTLRSLLFLSRICPSEADEVIELLSGRLNSDRTSTLAKIAIGAENLLAKKPDARQMHAHPKLVSDILRQGSWTPDEALMGLWMGLLANSCSVDAPDDSNEIFARLLGHFMPAQARILNHGCERALGLPSELRNSAFGAVVLAPREMIRVTGVHDLFRNATDLAHLFNLGLIQNIFDFTSHRRADNFDITPSRLGLELYKHCHGSREKVDPILVETANTHLAHFLPAPHPADDIDTSFSPLSSREGEPPHDARQKIQRPAVGRTGDDTVRLN